MSEQLKEELQTSEATETMADYEDHFDDAGSCSGCFAAIDWK